MSTTQPPFIQPEEDEQLIDFYKLGHILKQYWYLFALTFTIALSTAYVYLKYTTAVYSVSAKVFIKDRSNVSSGAKGFLEGSQLFQPFSNVDNEMVVLKSRTLVEKTIRQLNFSIALYTKGKIRDVEVYPIEGLTIHADTVYPILVHQSIFIHPTGPETFELSIENPGVKYYHTSTQSLSADVLNATRVQGRWGKPVFLGKAVFTLWKDSTYIFQKQALYFQCSTPQHLVGYWQGALSVSLVDKDASIVSLQAQHPIVTKARDFVNALARTYIQQGLDEKNAIATNTVNFIDIQLQLIKDTLNIIENRLVDFRSRNKVMNLTYEGQLSYSKLKELESEKAKLAIRHTYFKYIKDYVHAEKDYAALVVPSTLDINDPNLNRLIAELVSLGNEKNTLMTSGQTNDNPYVKSLNNKIVYTKQALMESLDNLDKSTLLSLSELERNITAVQATLSRMPATEKEFMNIDRKFKVNDEIYNYLLEKRAEASIARASSTADNKIIDTAVNYESRKVAPNNRSVWVLAFVLAIILPLAFCVYVYFSDSKVYSKEDVEKYTSLPFMGSVLHAPEGTPQNIIDAPKSGLAESIRSLKINLDFFKPPAKEGKIIGLTSFVSGEGKTFLGVNLASLYAFSGQKVVLVGMDMRKPRIDKELFADKEFGLSNYLAGLVELDKIIVPSGRHDNFFYIPTGIIPPNPSELMGSERMKKLIQYVKANFDIILFDNPPIGLVVDYLQIIKEVDVTLFVLRQGYTDVAALKFIDELQRNQQLQHIGVVLNDVKKSYSKYYQYGTGYYYGGYNSGYYDMREYKKTWWKFWLK